MCSGTTVRRKARTRSSRYRLPDYRGVVGIESGFDSLLRGRAGAESVLVNNLGYRQTEDVWSQPEPGHNIVLTIDLDIQQAAERSLAEHQGADARGAIVVMDVRTGDVLAMVSSPAFNPNDFAQGIFPPGEAARLNDPQLRPQINRATFENYAPGSIFKTVVALAALENGLDPNAIVFKSGTTPEIRATAHLCSGPASHPRHGAAGRLQLQARHRTFLQHLFHHRGPAGGH